MKIFDYLFYVYFKFWDGLPSPWWSEWKAIFTVCFVWISLLTGVSNFIMYLTVPHEPIITLIIVSTFCIYSFYYFMHKDRWKGKIKKFENIGKRRNIIGSLVVITFTIILISFMFYSITFLSEVNWKKLKEN